VRDSSGLFVSFQFSGFESFANSHKILAVFFEFTLNEQNFPEKFWLYMQMEGSQISKHKKTQDALWLGGHKNHCG
jgi:hypothetical protein